MNETILTADAERRPDDTWQPVILVNGEPAWHGALSYSLRRHALTAARTYIDRAIAVMTSGGGPS